jgi:hypothetical protein
MFILSKQISRKFLPTEAETLTDNTLFIGRCFFHYVGAIFTDCIRIYILCAGVAPVEVMKV